ncbi:MAG: hypothetical protein LUG21_04440 [Clostridiales bacterium]|nr:hypothetical protein [Clostridiales bacterium]
MEYERIILEMLSRIKKLEADVKELRENLNFENSEKISAPEKNNDSDLEINDEMIDLCYQYGKTAFENDISNIEILSEKAEKETGIPEKDAFSFISAVVSMLKGQELESSLSEKQMDRYLSYIFSEYGTDGLKTALNSVSARINRLKADGTQSDEENKIYIKYKTLLENEEML